MEIDGYGDGCVDLGVWYGGGTGGSHTEAGISPSYITAHENRYVLLGAGLRCMYSSDGDMGWHPDWRSKSHTLQIALEPGLGITGAVISAYLKTNLEYWA